MTHKTANLVASYLQYFIKQNCRLEIFVATTVRTNYCLSGVVIMMSFRAIFLPYLCVWTGKVIYRTKL